VFGQNNENVAARSQVDGMGWKNRINIDGFYC
jgi:hypothetical protein